MVSYWKCPECHGTGRVIFMGQAVECEKCDGTGNALVSGAEQRHRRALDEIDERNGKIVRWPPRLDRSQAGDSPDKVTRGADE